MTAGFTQRALSQLPSSPVNFTGDPLQITMAFSGLLSNLASWTLRVANILNAGFPPGGATPVSLGGTGSVSFTPANAVILAGATGTSPLHASTILTVSGTGAIMQLNTATPAPGPNTPLLQIIQADTTINLIELDASATNSQVLGFRSEGSVAVPLQTAAAANIISFGGAAWDSNSVHTGAIATIQFRTLNAPTNTDHSSQITFNTVPVGSTTIGVCANFTSQGCSILGTNTNDNAGIGYVGEYFSNIVLLANEVSINATANVCTLTNLPAGDFDVSGELWVDTSTGGATINGKVSAGITQTSATMPTVPADNTAKSDVDATVLASGTGALQIPVGHARISQNAPGNVYLVGQATVSAGTANGYGIIRARRRR